jgi:hypothetical protein
MAYADIRMHRMDNFKITRLTLKIMILCYPVAVSCAACFSQFWL